VIATMTANILNLWWTMANVDRRRLAGFDPGRRLGMAVHTKPAVF